MIDLFRIHSFGDIVWGMLYFITLGFGPKYRERLRLFESLDPAEADPDYERYSQPASFLGFPYIPREIIPGPEASHADAISGPVSTPRRPALRSNGAKPKIPLEQILAGDSLRSKQGGEWDKLSTAKSSVITATSAAALAIPTLAGPDSYWMVNTCFCAAFGVSLEGLILVNYINVIAAGASDETIGLLAKGKINILNTKDSPRIAALIMALPVVFETYSSIFLLIGSVVMVTQGPQNSNLERHLNAYRFLSLIPVGLGALCMCSVIIVCEVGTYREFRMRKGHEGKQQTRVLATSIAVSFVASPEHASTILKRDRSSAQASEVAELKSA